MTIPPVLAQQRLSVPQDQMRFSRPWQAGMRGEERPALRPFGCPLRSSAGEIGGFADAVAISLISPRLSKGSIGSLQTGVQEGSERRSPTPRGSPGVSQRD